MGHIFTSSQSTFHIPDFRESILDWLDATSKSREGAITLPGHAAHKEQWEPTIQRLFQNQQAAPRSTVRFHDIWSLDLPIPRFSMKGSSGVDTVHVSFTFFSWP